MIRESKCFIYIENQFFISNPGRKDIVENRIAEELKNRIIKAHRENKPFMAIVFIPLLPGFAGDVTKTTTAILRTQVRFFLTKLTDKTPTGINCKRCRFPFRPATAIWNKPK